MTPAENASKWSRRCPRGSLVDLSMSSHNVEVLTCCLVFDNSRSATDCSLRYCIGGNTVQEGTPGPRLAPKATAATMTALRSAPGAPAMTTTIPAEVFRKSGPYSSLTSGLDSYDG